MISGCQQDICENDIEAVINVLRSTFITQGKTIEAFEQSVSHLLNVSNAITTNSATSALHLSCLALNLKPDDTLWTSPISFVASANCALFCGATVDFIDIEPNTGNLSIGNLKKKLEAAKKTNQLPKIIVVVHLAGISCDMQQLKTLSEEYGFYIIEDAAHALGGNYNNKPIGNCQFSDITVFSFHAIKSITTGEGGMAVTNNAELANKMSLLRSHGVTRNPDLMTHKPDGDWYYQQVDLGFNYRMTDIQAALGNQQLKRLPAFIQRRREISFYYNKLLKHLPLILPKDEALRESACHLYIIQVKNNASHDRNTLFQTLKNAGVHVNVHYIPIPSQPYYQQLGFTMSSLPNAQRFYEQCLSLPIHYNLSNADCLYISELIDSYFNA